MADRIARPPVRLKGGFPDGNLCGIPDAVSKRFLSEDPEPAYALVRLSRRQLVHDDETEGDVAILGVSAIEVLDDVTLQGPLAQALADLRADRTGDNQLDFEGAGADHARLSELRAKLADWAAEEGLSDAAVAERVLATVPGAGPGWKDDARILGEFLRTVGAIADPPAGGGE